MDETPLSNPTSGVETIAGLTEFDDVADPELASCPKPCVGVKVIDHLNSTVYVWSIAKLEQRLQKMRNLYTFIDRPEYSQHFNWADPFYESPSPGFAFIGSALIPLSPISKHISAKYTLPILARHTTSPIGYCSVEVKFISLSAPTAKANGKNGNGALLPAFSQGSESDLPTGHKLGLQLVIDSVAGLTAEDFKSIHVQVRLTSLAGPSVTSDDTFSSVPVDLNSEGALADVKLRRTVSFVLTPQIAAYLRTGFAPVEFFARVKPLYLQELERFDASREGGKTHANGQANGSVKARPGMPRKATSGRLSEKEMVSEERHDVLAFVQICELGHSGEYEPVQVRAQSALDPGAFFLRQGLQRKFLLHLSHDSGRQFPWTRVSKMELGEVRMLDPKGRIHVSKMGDPVQLKVPLKQQSMEFRNNGTSELSLWAWWDSSVHDSIFLNRATASGHRILLRLSFHVDVQSCAEPAVFAMDLAVAINGRDARPPGKLMSILGSSRVLSKASALFNVRLTPPLTKRTKELWRLDTGTKYVRGEESLEGWKPRGMSLIQDHASLVRRERRLAEVESVKVLLKHLQSPMSNGSPRERNEEQLARKALAFWQQAVADGRKVSLLCMRWLSQEMES